MHEIIYRKLVDLAANERLTTYGEISPLANLSMDLEEDREKMSSLLEVIARHEQGHNRPMLTAVVVHKGDDNNPGEGFFKLAKEFGKYGGSRDPIQRLQFWVGQVREVYSYWQKT